MRSLQARRAQSSLEYLFIVVLALVLIIPASLLFFNFATSSEDAVIGAQINRIGNEILVNAEQVYVIGNGSRVTLDVTFPDSLIDARIYGEQELVFSFNTRAGFSQAVFFSDLNLTNGSIDCSGECSLYFSKGQNSIRIVSKGDYISIGG